MLKTKFIISLVLTITILLSQVGAVLVAPALQGPALITGTVQSITLETDINTGITTVLVSLLDENELSRMLRISLETAIPLGLVVLDGDGNPVINDSALGQSIEIDPTTVIPDEEVDRHPVGNALATFFTDISGLNYDQIMTAHNKGMGFGVIAQALWLTTKLEGNSDVFQLILHAKESGDYSAFILGNGSTPKNWGQLRKAILDANKNGSLGIVMSNKDKNKNNKGDGDGSNNVNSSDNGNNNGNGNAGDNGNNQDKDKDKNKDNHGNGNNK